MFKNVIFWIIKPEDETHRALILGNIHMSHGQIVQNNEVIVAIRQLDPDKSGLNTIN